LLERLSTVLLVDSLCLAATDGRFENEADRVRNSLYTR
jgi:hypothetical protein